MAFINNLALHEYFKRLAIMVQLKFFRTTKSLLLVITSLKKYIWKKLK